MGKTRRAQPSVETFAAHQIITPPNRLKKAVRKAARGDSDPVANAEAALAALSQHFAEWMEAEWQRLDAARAAIHGMDTTAQQWQNLFRAAHDIKGEAGTFGFPRVAAIAESLCRLIDHARDCTRLPHNLVDQHVDAVRAVMREPMVPEATKIADELTREISRATSEYLLSEDLDALGEQERAASPPLAPT